LARACSRWAAISEYTTAPLAVLLAARRGFPPAPDLVAPLVTGARSLLLLGSHASCFGSPWVLSYAREAYGAYAAMVSKGLVGFGAPSPRTAWNYLFHPARGLLLFSPFWLWLVPGFLAWWRSRTDRGDCLFALTATAGFFLLLTDIQTGRRRSLGNRPPSRSSSRPARCCAGDRVARVTRPFRPRARVLCGGPLPVDLRLAAPPGKPVLAAGDGVSLVSRERMDRAEPFFLSRLDLARAARAAHRLGRCPRRAGRASLSPRALVAAPAGLLLSVAAVLLAPEANFGARLWRAVVYGSYSGLDPAREELKHAVQSAATPREKTFAAEAWRRYGR
jgi:hypothetical protein